MPYFGGFGLLSRHVVRFEVLGVFYSGNNGFLWSLCVETREMCPDGVVVTGISAIFRWVDRELEFLALRF